jgi:hypothetical protein
LGIQKVPKSNEKTSKGCVEGEMGLLEGTKG